jgi:hypothetical protein
MSPRRHARLAIGFAVVLAGCSQSGSILSQRTSVGSLKTSVAHLEFENQQLRREASSLKDENRDLENRLVQEEAANGDLTARLDDARTLLGRRGLDGDSLEPSGASARNTIPAGESSRKRRKTPFAQIPGRIDPIPPAGTDPTPAADDDGYGRSWGKPAGPTRDDIGPTSQTDRSTLWLPIARGAADNAKPRR